MNFALIGLKFLGFGRAVMAWLSRRSLAELACIALAVFAVVQHFQLASARASTTRWHHQYTSEHAGRLQDRAAYEQAQRYAAGKNEAQINRVKQQQQEISNETVSTLSARIELIRSELRKQQASTPQRPAGGSQAGPASPSPCTVTDPAWLCLAPADRLRAAESEERHDELIDWVEQQMKVDPNE